MTDKEKQIEINTPTVQCKSYSQNDLVMLSREEYEKLLKIKEEMSVKEINYFSNLFKLQKELEQVEQERDSAIDNYNRKSKETAERVWNIAKTVVDSTKHMIQGKEFLHIDALKEIIKSCGVEIKE